MRGDIALDEIERNSAEMLMAHTTDIVISFVSNNSLSAGEVPAMIRDIHATLANLGETSAPAEEKPEPAVSVRASVKKDHIVCLEDGRKMKVLRRHLMTDHGMTPDEYRARWGLPSDYPMIAPDYADMRRDLARKSGLGRKPGQKRGRRKKSPR